MRMSNLASIVFACSIPLFSTLSFAQAPSDDGRCDVLSDSTPSLYGLCIAYWATQENGNSEASSKILEKYNNRKSDANPVDPDMPGLVACPCWTADQLSEWESRARPTISCSQEPDASGGIISAWTASGESDRLETYAGTYYSCLRSLDSTTAGDDETYLLRTDLDVTTYNSCLTDLSTLDACNF